MVRIWRRLEDLVGKILFFVILGASIAFERIAHGGQALAALASESGMDPQQTIVHLAGFLIVGSLSMIALGYQGRS